MIFIHGGNYLYEGTILPEFNGKFLSYTKTTEFDFYIRQGCTLEDLFRLKTYIDLGFLDLMTIREKDEYCMNIGIKTGKKLIRKSF